MSETLWAVLAVVVFLLALSVIVALAAHGRKQDMERSEARRAAREERIAAAAAARRDAAEQAEQAERQRVRRAAIIVNPTKFDDVEAVRAQVRRVCESHGWADPLWLETTPDDPGTGQAHEAVEAGVDLVCPLGGDGTVRSVAVALVEHDTPMGLLPGGTGNLLARNLELPIDSLEDALTVALTGRNDKVDVGTINVLVPGTTQDEAKDYVFLVMAGMGFDASVMADAPEKLKAQFGWPAYVVSGMKHLKGHRFDLDVSIDDAPVQHRRVRTVVIGNVGRLQGGLELLPNAEHDDGALDVVMLSPKGITGWASVGAHIATRNKRGHPRIEHRRFRTMRLEIEGTQEVQLDGDPIGPAGVLTIAVRPHALTIRVP